MPRANLLPRLTYTKSPCSRSRAFFYLYGMLRHLHTYSNPSGSRHGAGERKHLWKMETGECLWFAGTLLHPLPKAGFSRGSLRIDMTINEHFIECRKKSEYSEAFFSHAIALHHWEYVINVNQEKEELPQGAKDDLSGNIWVDKSSNIEEVFRIQ